MTLLTDSILRTTIQEVHEKPSNELALYQSTVRNLTKLEFGNIFCALFYRAVLSLSKYREFLINYVAFVFINKDRIIDLIEPNTKSADVFRRTFPLAASQATQSLQAVRKKQRFIDFLAAAKFRRSDAQAIAHQINFFEDRLIYTQLIALGGREFADLFARLEQEKASDPIVTACGEFFKRLRERSSSNLFSSFERWNQNQPTDTDLFVIAYAIKPFEEFLSDDKIRPQILSILKKLMPPAVYACLEKASEIQEKAHESFCQFLKDSLCAISYPTEKMPILLNQLTGFAPPEFDELGKEVGGNGFWEDRSKYEIAVQGSNPGNPLTLEQYTRDKDRQPQTVIFNHEGIQYRKCGTGDNFDLDKHLSRLAAGDEEMLKALCQASIQDISIKSKNFLEQTLFAAGLYFDPREFDWNFPTLEDPIQREFHRISSDQFQVIDTCPTIARNMIDDEQTDLGLFIQRTLTFTKDAESGLWICTSFDWEII